MNGLRIVWIISRHYKTDDKMQNLIQLISSEIADKVEKQIDIQKLFTLNEERPYEEQMQQSIDLINQGSKILKKWKELWKSTKQKIEEDGPGERWEFTFNALTGRIEPMINVLRELSIVAETLKKFLVFLGPNLKAVTGNSEGIDRLVEDVKGLVKPFIGHQFNDFIKTSSSQSTSWTTCYSKFKTERQSIEHNTTNLIHATFKDLRSAEGAFELLQKFKNVGTLEEISKQLQQKYSAVLGRYSDEVKKNRDLFLAGK